MKKQNRNKLIQDLEDYTEGQNSNITGNPTQVYFRSLSVNQLRFVLTINIDGSIQNSEQLICYIKNLIAKKYDKNFNY